MNDWHALIHHASFVKVKKKKSKSINALNFLTEIHKTFCYKVTPCNSYK